MLNDLQLAVRRLRLSPGFTLAATLTLALGIGANVAIFSVANAAVLRWRDAFAEPERLVMLWKHEAQYGNWHTTPGDFRDWREQSASFAAMGGFTYRTSTLATAAGEDPRRVLAGRLTPGFFAMLGVAPRLGREFAGDDVPWGRHRVAVLSDGLWRGRYGADPEVVGRALLLDGETFTIVGVMPAGAWLAPRPAQLWIPLTYREADAWHARNSNWFQAVARLRSGVSLAQARAEMAALGTRIAEEHPENVGWSIAVTTLEETALGAVAPLLAALGGAVALVLLLACVNVAALVLARAERHAPEMAVRAALGAGRGRLMRLVLAEGVVLAALGGTLGLGLARLAVDQLYRLVPAAVPRVHETGIAVDGRVLAFTVGVTLLTAVGFALVPAWRAASPRPGTGLVPATRGAVGGRRGRRYRASLVAAEVALSAMLLVAAGLLIRTVGHLGAIDLGVRGGELLTLDVEVPAPASEDLALGTAFLDRVAERVRALGAVRSAGVTTALPLEDGGPGFYLGVDLGVDGRAEPATLGEVPIIRLIQVGDGALEALGVALVRGRFFDRRDGVGGERVAVIEERTAERYFAGEDPLGRTVRLGAPGFPWLADEIAAAGGQGPPRYRVVGIVRDVRYQAFDDLPGAVVYIPYRQQHWPTMGWLPRHLVAHTAGPPLAAAPAIRAELRALDPGQPLGRARTVDDLAAEAFRGTRFAVELFSLFAALALILAVVGIYGVIAYSVARRRREIGVRMALGAERRHVIGLVSRQAVVAAAIGLVFGIAGAALLSRYLDTLLRGVGRHDPLTFALVAATLLAVAALAAYLPARRAAAIQPSEALAVE